MATIVSINVRDDQAIEYGAYIAIQFDIIEKEDLEIDENDPNLEPVKPEAPEGFEVVGLKNGYYVSSGLQAWTRVTEENPDGIISFNDTEALKATENERRIALNITEPTYTEDEDSFEFAAPILIQHKDEDDEATGEKLKAGAIIYRFSTEPMHASIKQAEDEFLKETTLTLTLMVVLGLVGLAAGFFVTRRQAATITQPLAKLTSATDSIASGDYSVEVEVRSGDELETLASSFNLMAKDLDRSYADLQTKNRQLLEARNELEDLNRHLEEKVEERTRQLAESESKFRTLFEKSADAILVSDEEVFLDCNPAMLTMMGMGAKDELLALTPEAIAPTTQPDGTPSTAKLHEIHQLAQKEGSRQFEWVFKKLDSEEFHTEVVATSFVLNEKQVLHMVIRDISERKSTEEKLRLTQQKLVETAHGAGMAEIATGVLHNIGNILNSVNISTEEIFNTLKASKLRGLVKANEMVARHRDDYAAFFANHPKGKLIPGYFNSLGEAMKEEHELMVDEVQALTEKVSMMRDVISTQQSYAKATLYTEEVSISDLVEDALKLQQAALLKQGVNIIKKYDYTPRCSVPKVKLVHVLTNLIKNAKEAMRDVDSEVEQEMVLEIRERHPGQVDIVLTDNGCGIKPVNLEKIFNHGFTTKDEGHGFGLHTCANFMTEMGGSLVAESEGLGHGSVFTVTFPLVCKGPKQYAD